MIDVKKIAGLASIIVTTTISTVISQWMTEREIATKISDALTKKK